LIPEPPGGKNWCAGEVGGDMSDPQGSPFDSLHSLRAGCAGRRAFLKMGIGLGLGLRVPSILAEGQDDRASLRPQEGDLLVKSGDSSATPLTPDDIPLGAMPTMAWAMDPSDRTLRSGSRLNQLLLLRLDPETLVPETRSRAAKGVVAYTAICTHSGCDIDNWLADEQLLSCSCHESRFDPKDGARVIDGPAPRMLPALPLKVVDGKLVVAQPFTSKVGFETG
jgi:Rieske Fe-S protein